MRNRWGYYMIMRPMGPGCQPSGFIEWEECDGETVIPAINRTAWAWLLYDRKLTPEEIRDYELVECPAACNTCRHFVCAEMDRNFCDKHLTMKDGKCDSWE
jgi:hypothetical protein